MIIDIDNLTAEELLDLILFSVPLSAKAQDELVTALKDEMHIYNLLQESESK